MSAIIQLPVELLYQIIELALAQEAHVVVSEHSICRPADYEGCVRLSGDTFVHTPLKHPLALAQTLTQLQYDTLHTFFVVNVFKMEISLESRTGFTSLAIIGKTTNYPVGFVERVLREFSSYFGNDSRDTAEKRLRLVLDLDDIPIQRIAFHGRHKMVAAFLSKIKQLTIDNRTFTPLRPCITVVSSFSSSARAAASGSTSERRELRIPIEIDIDKEYESLEASIGSVKTETDRGGKAYEMLSTCDPDWKAKPETAVSASLATDSMRLWQQEFLPRNID